MEICTIKDGCGDSKKLYIINDTIEDFSILYNLWWFVIAVREGGVNGMQIKLTHKDY